MDHTPLPIAFPNDENVYGHENATDRAYEWMISDSMLVPPLYGNDYATANTRNIYLPAGRWMDFDTGKIYEGSQTLLAFPMPPGKTPLFIGCSGITLEDFGGTLKAVITLLLFTLPQHSLFDGGSSIQDRSPRPHIGRTLERHSDHR